MAIAKRRVVPAVVVVALALGAAGPAAARERLQHGPARHPAHLWRQASRSRFPRRCCPPLRRR